MISQNLTVGIIAKNEESRIQDCLKSISELADEIILINNGSSDKTVEVAQNFDPKIKIFDSSSTSFSELRNLILEKSQNPWLLYIDADERLSTALQQEIKQILNSKSSFIAYKIPRVNYYFGKNKWPKVEMMERFFLKDALLEWKGDLHESPIIKGGISELKNPLFHYTHTNISSMVEKTNAWSEIEANIIFQTNHPKMKSWRFLRIMLTKFWDSYVKQQGYKLGTVGLIESMYQAFSYFIVYAKLWEKQKS